MYKGNDGERTELYLSTAGIIQVQPIQIWTRTQPILRQALLSPDKSDEKSDDVKEGEDVENIEVGKSSSQTKKRQMQKADTESIDTIQLYTADSTPEPTEYSSDLLASLSTITLPNLTSSQLTSLLSEIDIPLQQRLTPVERRTAEVKEKTVQALPSADDICLEKRSCPGGSYYRCVRCEHICLSDERALSHQERCPGRPNKIACIACNNSFKSTAVLKMDNLGTPAYNTRSKAIGAMVLDKEVIPPSEAETIVGPMGHSTQIGLGDESLTESEESVDISASTHLNSIIEGIDEMVQNPGDEAHLLIDHGVSVDEHPAFITMNLGSHHNDETEVLSTQIQDESSDGRGETRKEQEVVEAIILPDATGIPDSPSTNITISADSKNTHPMGALLLPRVPVFSLFDTVEKFLAQNGNTKEGGQSENFNEEQKDKGEYLEPNSSSKSSVKLEKQKIRCSMDGCMVKLSSPSSMDYHRLCHTKEGWRCPECSSTTFTSWSNLSVHLWRRHSLDMELYSCDQCSYKTNSLSKLMNLHRRTHGSERPFVCDVCQKGFKTTKQLRNHKGVHRRNKDGGTREKNGTEGTSDCLTCGRTFTCARLLRQHADIVHRRLRPYLCPDCGHSAASRSSLRMHVRHRHSGEKPYTCNDCDFSTPDHNTLRRHKMRHSGAKPYSCPHCPYASIQSSTYKAHLKNKHPGLDEGLMYSCEICPFRTVKRDNFLAHTSHHALRTTDNV